MYRHFDGISKCLGCLFKSGVLDLSMMKIRVLCKFNYIILCFSYHFFIKRNFYIIILESAFSRWERRYLPITLTSKSVKLTKSRSAISRTLNRGKLRNLDN